MLLKIVEQHENVFGLTNGKVVVGYRCSLVDVETSDLEHFERGLAAALKTLRPDAVLRFWLKSGVSQESAGDHSRAEAIAKLGFAVNELSVIVEIPPPRIGGVLKHFRKREENLLAERAHEIRAAFDLEALKQSGFKLKPLTRDEFEKLLPEVGSDFISANSFSVETGAELVGCLRLVKQSAFAISPLKLSELKDELSLPYEIRVSLKRLANEKSESLLRRRANQVKGQEDQVSVSKHAGTEESLAAVALEGQSLFQMEVLILVPRKTEGELRTDLVEMLSKLKPLGDWIIETVGVLPTFLASQVGSDQHVPILESDEALACFLPVLTAGASGATAPAPSALVLHRVDQSLDHVDLFSSGYDNYSACIFGKSGRGKSVLTNLLTRALLNDPLVHVIKVDVGGSHSKETELLGGVERRLSLSEPSGINPFSVLSEGPHSEVWPDSSRQGRSFGSATREESGFNPSGLSEVLGVMPSGHPDPTACNVIAAFVGVLLLEEGETKLSKEMRGEIEHAVEAYSESKPANPTLDGFYEHAASLPRRTLLKRWTAGGVFGNAFAAHAGARESLSSTRLTYFNFSEIFQAADPDFGQGGLAAIIAQFNIELLRAKGKKLVFICDETPFFIERCFSFFKFSTANVRKFGGSFIVIAQKSSDVVVGGDTGILDNTGSKFLFSVDGEREGFGRRLKLEESVVERVEGLESVKGEYSESVFLDGSGARTFRVQLSGEEYWRTTSSAGDRQKMEALMGAVPGLTVEEGIRVLGR